MTCFFALLVRNCFISFERVSVMAVTYLKLWHLLLDRKLKKKDLQQQAHLSGYTMHKLGRDETVTTDTISRICIFLKCTPDDIMEIIPDPETHD